MNVCSKCKKQFGYAATQSRIDGSDLCRVCSAEEALDAAGVADKEAILTTVAESENA